MTVQLSLQGLNKYYGPVLRGVHAVKDLDMEIRQGDIVALLGSSGCGKTSTLRMVAGFEEVSQGKIILAGREIQALPPVRRNVAMAFEGYSLYPTVTVRENIAFALKAQRESDADVRAKVQDVAEMLEIAGILDRYPSSISGGQQQRASLARALVRKADLYLLDEPMGQLEPQLRTLLRGRIKFYIKERGLTAILVTHDQAEANAMADQIAVMEAGVLQQFASPEQIKTAPANLFTGTFVGEPPMNTFAAKAVTEGDALVLRLADNVVLRYPATDFAPEVRAAILSRGDVMLGLRPYSVRMSRTGGSPAQVLANQWLGDQTHIAASFAGGTLVLVEHDRADVQVGQSIGIALPADALHIFDPETGRAISHGTEMA